MCWFPDRFLISPGHMLVVPKRHEADFFAPSESEQVAILQLTRQRQRDVAESTAATAFNVGSMPGPTRSDRGPRPFSSRTEIPRRCRRPSRGSEVDHPRQGRLLAALTHSAGAHERSLDCLLPGRGLDAECCEATKTAGDQPSSKTPVAIGKSGICPGQRLARDFPYKEKVRCSSHLTPTEKCPSVFGFPRSTSDGAHLRSAPGPRQSLLASAPSGLGAVGSFPTTRAPKAG